MSNKVFVVDAEGKPLLPTNPARARLLLKLNMADVECVIPFTIRLKRVVGNPVGSFGVGIDDGSKHVGVAIVNDVTKEAVFVGEIELRQDVKRLVRQRAQYRRSRRSCKLRHRKPRFNNRIGNKIPPSIRARKDSIIRFIKDMLKRVNITHAVIEEVRFNHAVYSWGKWFSLVEIGKMYLREQLNALSLAVKTVSGWMTANWRRITGTTKSHGVDAAVILGKQDKVTLPETHFVILPRRARIWEENPTKKYSERLGFRHWDIVKAERAGENVIGCVRSLKTKQLALRTAKDGNFLVSYSKSCLICRPDGLVYLPII